MADPAVATVVTGPLHPSVIDKLMLGLIALDEDARVCSWNQWMARHTNIPANQAIGRELGELFPDGVSPALRKAIQCSLSGGMSRMLTHAVHGQLLPLRHGANRQGNPETLALNVFLQPLSATPQTPGRCLIQVFDVTGPVRREQMLEQEVYQNRRSSLIDDLTGQLNRRAFDIWLGAEWRRQQATGEPVSVMMVDVDQFKLFNDINGHVSGDRCLRRVAHAMARRINRPGDALFRYGGEEFAVLLTTTDCRGAAIVAESLLQTVRKLGIPHPATRAPVTVSIGFMAGQPAVNGASPGDYVAAADQALYSAKRAGRNRFRAHPDAEVTDVSLSLAGRRARIFDRELMRDDIEPGLVDTSELRSHTA